MSDGNSGKPVRVFVSSTWEDLQPERKAVEEALNRLRDGEFSGMEYFGSRPDTTKKVSLKEVDKSDIYVGIFAHRYGSGITEAEYRRARKRDIPCLIYFKDESVPVLPKHMESDQAKVKKLKALRKKLKKDHTCSPFKNPDNLATKVVVDLRTEIPKVSGLGEPEFAHPYPLQPNFTGRVEERTNLTEWLTKGGQPVYALVAFGGMGKSALAWAWLVRDVLGEPLPGAAADSPEDAAACRVPDDARPEGAFWWSFYEKDSTFKGFLDKALAYAAGGRIPESVEGAYEKMEALVELLREKRLLLVLDGFERLLHQYASMEAVYQRDDAGEVPAHDRACADPNAAKFLRRLAGGPFESRVLLTSRVFPRELEGDGGEAVANCRLEKLESMNPEDAVTFFRAQGIKGNRGEIEAACSTYGYHPLALRLLARVIVKDKQTPGDIQVAGRHPVLPELKGKEQHHILQVAYDAMNTQERRLLSRIAAFRSPVDYEAVSIFKASKNGQFDSMLEELIDRGLLLFDSKRVRYDLHPVVRGHAYERLRGKKRVHERLAEYFGGISVPERKDVRNVEELAPLIELFYHTFGAGQYDKALKLYIARLSSTLYYRLGAYQTCIEMLRARLAEEDDRPPRSREEVPGWTLNELANSHAVSGQPRRAVELLEQAITQAIKSGKQKNEATSQRNLGVLRMALGELPQAESDFRKAIELTREVEDEFGEAVGHRMMGDVLAYRGQAGEAEQEFAKAEANYGAGRTQGSCLLESSRALAALLAGNVKAAGQAARRARKFADDVADERGSVERDVVRAEWLIGAVLLALKPTGSHLRKNHLTEAETHVSEALTRCRRIDMVDYEAAILLSWARWHRAKDDAGQAREHANEALSIADRCEYRLVQADIHNFLAALALEEGDRETAVEHATTGYERAWCDGPPHAYQPALDEAKRLLDKLGVEPPEMKPYKE